MINATLTENRIVHISFTSELGVACEAVGVFVKETEEYVQIGFNAYKNGVKDFLNIPKKHIEHIQDVDPLTIKILR